MIRVYSWNPEATPTCAVSHERPAGTAADLGQGAVWIDLENPSVDEEQWALRDFLPIHPLTVEDMTKSFVENGHSAHLPKVEEFRDYLFAIVNPLPAWVTQSRKPGHESDPDIPPKSNGRTSRPQLNAVLTRNVLITHHYDSLKCIDEVRNYVERHEECGPRGPDYVFHLILDAMVDEYAPVVERIADRLDKLETALFLRATPDLLHSLLRLKRRVSFMRKTLIIEREVLYRLSRGEFALVEQRETVYYRNVYDHLVRYAELTESAREMVSDLMQTHLSAVSNRMNQIMKILTMITTAVLPMTLVAGIYGMNFENMPELKWENGYFMALGLMLAMGLSAVGFFKWKRWL